MDREEAIKRIKAYKRYLMGGNPIWSVEEVAKAFDMAIEALEYIEKHKDILELVNVFAELGFDTNKIIWSAQEWIPCSERLPEDIRPVLVTWKNNDPASYYQYIVGKHFIGTAHYYRGKWYLYSSVTEDLLAEYGKCDTEEFDEAIEAVAWMPLPEPYKAESEDKK